MSWAGDWSDWVPAPDVDAPQEPTIRPTRYDPRPVALGGQYGNVTRTEYRWNEKAQEMVVVHGVQPFNLSALKFALADQRKKSPVTRLVLVFPNDCVPEDLMRWLLKSEFIRAEHDAAVGNLVAFSKSYVKPQKTDDESRSLTADEKLAEAKRQTRRTSPVPAPVCEDLRPTMRD